MGDRRKGAKKIARKHGIKDVAGLHAMIARAKSAYEKGASMEETDVELRILVRRAKKLKRILGRAGRAWRELEDSDRRRLECVYAQDKPFDLEGGFEEGWGDLMKSKPFESDLRSMLYSVRDFDHHTYRGQLPKYATKETLLIIYDYWTKELGETSKSERFLGLAGDVISQFGDPSHVRSLWETIKKYPESS